MHSTNNLDDNYYGSGFRLKKSLRKYGKALHIVEDLKFFDTREEMIFAEKKIVTTDLIKDRLCLNVIEGGTGGFLGIMDLDRRNKLSSSIKTFYARNPRVKKEKVIKSALEKSENYKIGNIAKNKGRKLPTRSKEHSDKLREKALGRKMSEETKAKIRETLQNRFKK